MRKARGRALVAWSLGLGVVACRSHDPSTALQVSGVETFWIVDTPRQGQNFIAPAVRFRLENVSSRPLGAVQARARFPAPDQHEAWGSIQEQVSTWRRPLEPGADTLVTVRSAGRYHSAAEPDEILRSPGFKDPLVEVFVRIGSSEWALVAQAHVERRIGAPGLLPLHAP